MATRAPKRKRAGQAQTTGPVAPAAPSRPRGRPAGGDAEIRGALLARARELFLRHGFGAVSTRRIATAAGTTSAMIHYYFGDKLGLYEAMLDEASAPLLANLRRLEQLPAGAEPGLESLVESYMAMLAANPWLPGLIVHEVLHEGGRLRERFVEHFAGRVAPVVIAILQRERDRGRLRGDLDPKLTAISALSLCIFPFVSLPVTSRVLGFSMQGERFDQLLRHTTRLLLEGVAVRVQEKTP